MNFKDTERNIKLLRNKSLCSLVEKYQCFERKCYSFLGFDLPPAGLFVAFRGAVPSRLAAEA
jgi:hypothetical protein